MIAYRGTARRRVRKIEISEPTVSRSFTSTVSLDEYRAFLYGPRV